MANDHSSPGTDILERIARGEISAEEAFSLLTDKGQGAAAAAPPADPRDIAIIGISLRLPGADSMDQLWGMLSEGRSAITEIPPERWDVEAYYDPDPKAKDRCVSRWGGFLRGAEEFDPQFFAISPKEAELMDPQQRLFLQEAYRAFEDAGLSDERLSGSRCGVYAGFGGSGYEALLNDRGVENDPFVLSGNAGAIMPARVSYFLNLRGPCLILDTACSSSFVALHLACQALRDNECDIALAGGATIFPHPKFYVLAGKSGMLSPDGKCKTFDESANGFVPAEGVAAVIVKRLADAIADGDHIYGVVKGTGINQDGKTNGITAPSGPSQTDLECAVYDRYGINPETISYVEAHGTGTKLGDPIEVDALITAFSRYSSKEGFCGLGSIKTNIGHTQIVAGMAGLAKVLLCMKHKKLVPSLHVKSINPLIRLEQTPFYITKDLTDWTAPGGAPRRAALSAFGFSGTNAHVIVDEYERPTAKADRRSVYPIWLSGRDKSALRRRIADLKTFIAEHPEASLADIAHTLLRGRSHLATRIALTVGSLDELRAALDAFDVDSVRALDKRTTKTLDADALATLLESLRATAGPAAREAIGALNDAYLRGHRMDLTRVGNAIGGRLIPLPTYPFEPRRFWAPEGKAPARTLPMSVSDPARPLVRRIESDANGARYVCELQGNEFFLQDHVIADQQTLPGVAYLEIARAAAADFQDAAAVGVQNVVWAAPVRVARGESFTIEVTLRRRKTGIEYELASGAGDARVLHGQGTVIFDERPAAGGREVPARFDVPALIAACSSPLQGCYEIFAGFGYCYGPRMQGIRELRPSARGCIASIALPDAARREPFAFTLHPALLDSVLQTVNGVFYESELEDKRLYLPFSIGRMTWKKSLPERGYAYAVPVATPASGSVRRFDVHLLDEAGDVVFTMADVIFRAVGDAPSSAALIVNRWAASMVDERAPSDVPTQILGNGDLAQAMGAELARTERADGERIVFVIDEPAAHDVDARLRVTFDAVLDLANRAWSERRGRAELVVVSEGTPGRAHDPAAFALHALLRSVAFECPPLVAREILIEADPRVPIAARASAIRTELARTDALVRLTIAPSGAVTREVWSLARASREASGSAKVKRGGRYILTGGLGAIGKHFARYLARTFGARLVIAGRRAQGDAERGFIDELRTLGGDARYVRSDIADLRQCYRLRDLALAFGGGVDGILHIAGVNRDALARDKSADDIDAVLRAKVHAANNLERAFATERLDFVALFSSLSGVFGNAGQADYAFANAYMDQFARDAERFNGARVVSIAWPLWEDGGMRPDEETVRMMKRLLGIRPLGTEAALRAFPQMLASSESCLGIVDGDVDKILEQFAKASAGTPRIAPSPAPARKAEAPPAPLPTPPAAIAPPPAPVALAAPSAPRPKADAASGIESKVRTDLLQDIASILKVKPEEVDAEADMTDLGFDSITFTKFSNHISDRYGCDVVPSTFFEYPTLLSFVGHFIEEHRATLVDHYAA